MNQLDEDSTECAERAKQQDSDIKIQYESQKDAIIPSPHPSPSTSHPTRAPEKSTAPNKNELYLAQSLKTKKISVHLSTLNVQSDSIQSMTLLYSTVTMMVFVGTCGIAFLPDFDSIDESFEFRKELVPKPSHQDHQA